MKPRTVDVAIIGAGTAGLNARREVADAGGRPLLIEHGPYGTTCARVGCMPSKLLIAPAHMAVEARRCEQMGLKHNGFTIDGAAVMRYVQKERDGFVEGMVRLTEEIPAAQRLNGHARFVGPTTLDVDGVRVEARAVVIATGSHPVIPKPFDKYADHLLTSDDIFDIPNLPESLAVIGTGVVGLELGQAMHRLGVRTAFFSIVDTIGPFTDPEILAVSARLFSQELTFHLSSKVTEVFRDGGMMHLRWIDKDGQEHREAFEKVFVSAGRAPNIAGLDLDKTGLPLNAKGMPAWDHNTMQCGQSPIFMAGDVNGYLAVLHEAAHEGIIAGLNAVAYPAVKPFPRKTPLLIVYTEPQLAAAGKQYAQMEADAFEIGGADFADQSRARIMGQDRGLLRIYGDRQKCCICGAEMIGPGMEHLAHLLAWTIQQGMTVQQSLKMPFYHPTLEEGLRTALRELASKLEVTGQCRRVDMAITPGQ